MTYPKSQEQLAFEEFTGANKFQVPQTLGDIIRSKLGETQGLKYDMDKAPMSLLSREALEQTAQVLAFGAKKYAAHN